MNALWRAPAHQLASMIRAGRCTSREVVLAHLERADLVNNQINAVTAVLREQALAAADAFDARGDRALPLGGVPFSVKESVDVAGSATTLGVPRAARQLATSDAPIVERLKAAGAIPLFRTNMSEMGMRLHTTNPLRGATVNPWRADRTPGGSSGGDAAAVATGMVPFGVGNDVGGSLRSPAYCCGVMALKPTAGRIPHASSLPPRDHGLATQLMLVQGILARSVDDLSLTLTACAGRHRRDPRSIDAPLVGPAAPKVAGVVTQAGGRRLDTHTLAGVHGAARRLRDAGWRVEEIALPELERVHEVWGVIFSDDLKATLPSLTPLLSVPLHGYLKAVLGSFHASLTTYEAHVERSRLARLWSALFARCPVVLCPTWTCPPWPPDADLGADGVERVAKTATFLLPASLLGFPSLALPIGEIEETPTGVQVMADLWREDLCLQAGADIARQGILATPIDPLG